MTEPSLKRVVLLGTQRTDPDLGSVVESLDAAGGPIATVTAGWEEREGEDEELAAHLGVETHNLGLWPRMEEVLQRDGELLRALNERDDRLRELQNLYRLRLGHALEAARELLHKDGEAALLEPEREAAISAVHALDQHHRQRTRELVAEFQAQWNTVERDDIGHHREQVRALLDGCSCLCIAGGHVAVLLHRLRLFGVLDLWDPERPVIGWGAGAMVLSDELVLFHDFPPQGAGNAEVLEAGLGVAPGIVPLPHADRRLALDDATRVALFARRFEPAFSVALEKGSRVDWDGEVWTGAAGTRLLTASGELEEFGTRAPLAEVLHP